MIFNKAYKSESREDFLSFLRVKLFGDNLIENIRPLGIDRQTIFFDKENCFELGKVNLDKDITVFEIKQKSKNDPRITLTRDAFKVMEDKGINIALIVFYSDDSPSWRLSLLTLKKSWGEKEISDPKRYSFLLGEGEKTRTPEKYLNKQINNFDDLLKCFDVEVVRKEFFNHYLTLYIKLYKAVLDDKEFVSLLKGQQVELVSFTKNLLGKIIFLYFIQKKGWLGVKRDGEYGKDGDKNFMRSIWDDFKNNEESLTLEKTGYFYNDYLEWLFFDGLNKDRRESEDYFPNLKMKVPYLNGGLFKEDYKRWDDNIARISNDIFSNNNKDGILDIFDTYNFTIDEDDLYDSDIAIDPEMLGRIFEKMISISPDNIDDILKIFESKKKIEIDKELNKKFGAFYTPREIVHYMTKESLISYLINNLTGKKEDNERKIRILFNLKEKFLITRTEITEKTFDELAEIIEKIDNLLQKVKILDPAIGSGAFPMGILHEISTIRYYIYGAFYIKFKVDDKILDFLVDNPVFKLTGKGPEKKVSMYKIKRDIIQKSIYGVDISAGAIDIAKLRFWLSLVVDEETPEPLPNFEFKFVCANTLIPLAEEPGQIHLEFDKELNIETLRKYMGQYYNAQTNSKKEEYKALISKYLGFGKNIKLDFGNKSERTKQLETYEPFNSNHSAGFFDPSLMMGNSKFDIVIGNPPYIDIKQIENNFVKFLFKNYKTAENRINLYSIFIERGNDLLKNNGILSYINPNSMLINNSYYKLREDIINSLYKIIKLPDNIFENATVETIILMLVKNIGGDNIYGKYYKNNDNANLKDIHFKTFSKKLWNLDEKKKFNIFISDKISNVLLKINKTSNKFIDLFDFTLGITPYDKYKGHSQEIIKNRLFHSDTKLDDEYKPIISGTNINKYFISDNPTEYIRYGEWLGAPREERFFTEPRIIIRQILSGKPPKIFAGYTDKSLYNAQIGFTLLPKKKNDIGLLKFTTGFLNSSLLNFYHKYTFLDIEKTTFQKILIASCKEFPIKELSEKKQKPFIELVDKILEITKQDFYNPKNLPKEQLDLESEIDDMVYELYGLSEEEVRVVEESLG